VDEITTGARPFYERFGWAYDLLVADPVEPWVDAICTALDAHQFIAPAEILDAGCGTGRHAEELARRGHNMVLVDASEPLLAQARRRLPTAAASHADLRNLELHASFDAIACRGVLNDFVDDNDRDTVLVGLARHLRPGGVLVLDVRDLAGTAERYSNGRHTKKVIETQRGRLTYTSAASLNGRVLRVDERHELHGRTGDVVAEHVLFMRPWTADELRDRLARAGFTDVSLASGAGRTTRDRLLCTATAIRT
jgi:ubiquinone/menaquinone biosynthesis C-methylase UbiE